MVFHLQGVEIPAGSASVGSDSPSAAQGVEEMPFMFCRRSVKLLASCLFMCMKQHEFQVCIEWHFKCSKNTSAFVKITRKDCGRSP